MKKPVFIILALFVSVSTLLAQNVGKMDNDTLINFIDINKNKQGKWVKYYDSGGIRYKGFFIDDKPTGTFTYYHPNKMIKSVINYNDDGTSTVEIFWDNGQRAAKGYYDTDRNRDKKWFLYFEDGVLSSVITYKNGIADGEVRMYYPGTGKRVLECNYQNGKLHGYYKKFFESGIVQEEGTYDNGSRHGYWKFNATTGLVEEEGNYERGKRHGDWIVYKDKPKGDTINYYLDRPENFDETIKEWQDKQDWAKENQHLFKQPEDYLDNPLEFFKPSRDPKTQIK